jgi:16S rRNA (guanine527-N7)-methyltransferase
MARPANGQVVLDVGAGGGAFAVAAALIGPGSHVVAVDSNQKAAAFIESVGAELGLANLSVRCERVESLQAELGASADIVGCRALADQLDSMRLIAPLVRTGGAALAWGTWVGAGGAGLGHEFADWGRRACDLGEFAPGLGLLCLRRPM